MSNKELMTRRKFLGLCAAGMGGLLAACVPEPVKQILTATPPPIVAKETPIVFTRVSPTIIVTTITPESFATPTSTPIPTSTPEVVPTVKIESKQKKPLKN